MRRIALGLVFSLYFCGVASAAYDFDADWYETGVVGDGWGDAATTVGDVNGDGYSDIMIGSPEFGGSPFWSKGKISLYYGSPTGPGSEPDWEFAVNLAFQQLGWSIAPAGDMNMDGFADFVVGAPGYSNGHNEEGRLYFFLGSANGPISAAQAEINEEDARLGHSVSYAGDLNGDGYDDIVAGAPGWGGFGVPFFIPVQGRAYAFYGGPSGPDGTPDWIRSGGHENGEFGWSVAGLGDVNGDGFADVMVGQPGYDPGILDANFGAVYCYYGSATGPSTSPDWSQVGEVAGDHFGRVVAYLGDFGGSGFAGAMIGVPDFNGGSGALYISAGSPSGLSEAVRMFSAVSSSWGGTASTIGDFNGDGRSDICVGGGVDDDAYVYFGDLFGGLEKRINGTQQFATLVASAGDVNGDGLSDFLVTDPLDQLGAGSVRIYFGGQEIEYSVPSFEQESGAPASTEELGASIADAGDVNGDGIGDLLVGAPGAQGIGELRLYYGKDYPLAPQPNWTATGQGPNGRFGAAACSAGDVNGDGYADIVATDPELQQVHVFHGSAGGPAATADWIYTYPEPGVEFGAAVTGGSDINGDGYADIAVGIPGHGLDRGRVRVFFGSRAGILDQGYVDLDQTLDKRFGSALAMFGDGNGDGFDDLAVGAPGGFGRVVIHYGAADGFQNFRTMFSGAENGGQMGYSVAAAGDVNGDGFADVIAGEPLADVSFVDDGKAYVLFGNSPTLDSKIAFDAAAVSSDVRFGQSVCGIGDYDGSGRSVIAASAWDAGTGLTFVRVYEYTTVMVTRSSFEIFYPDHGLVLAGVGAVDGGGSPMLGMGKPARQNQDGEFAVYGPIPARALIPPSARPKVTTTGNEPIALRGLHHHTDGLRFSMRAWLPTGRTHLNLEWNLGEERQPFAYSGVGSWTPSATHIGGTNLSVDAGVVLSPGDRYRWRLRVLSSNPYMPRGPWLTSQPNSYTLYGLRAVDTVTAVEDATPHLRVSLDGAFPNPFNPSTELEFRLGAKGPVEVDVYDVAGRLVRTLHRGILDSGAHRMRWNGTDDTGAGVASGVYLAVVRSGDAESSLKMTLVK